MQTTLTGAVVGQRAGVERLPSKPRPTHLSPSSPRHTSAASPAPATQPSHVDSDKCVYARVRINMSHICVHGYIRVWRHTCDVV